MSGHWSGDLPGLTEANARRLLSWAADEDVVLGGIAVDPAEAFSAHMDRGTVAAPLVSLEVALYGPTSGLVRAGLLDLPFLLGHEAAGIMESVGPDVADIAPGDFVILSWYGDCLPSRDFPMLIDLHLQGRLPLDAFVSETIGLADIEAAFAKMRNGDVLRSVVVF